MVVDDADPLNPAAAERYREGAKFLRRQAEGAHTATYRLHLLRIADECDRLADRMEQARAAASKRKPTG